jgi:predicted DNA-binding protein (MmcQ/YjbR family)
MISISTFRQLALSFAETTEQPHFEKTSFMVNKKIFATLDENNNKAVVKLSAVDQSVFCAFDKTIIYPVPGKWGLQGWTMIELKKIKKEMLIDALTTSYCTVAPKKLTEKYRGQ